jgi:hypothetical protein
MLHILFVLNLQINILALHFPTFHIIIHYKIKKLKLPIVNNFLKIDKFNWDLNKKQKSYPESDQYYA